ncbi:hypothetical protein GCM10023211_09260 [Orbus sasakiae]|uniref:YokE-like PH domain-containing protein n=1 Tax=Orbus sasakiae TaxID=1078475 RepID=A0ABP9N2F6_9GAMM
MEIMVRIKRILSDMERFTYLSGYDEELGEIFGVYDNKPEKDSLYICQNGIFWNVNSERVSIKYRDILSIEFEDPKKSIFIKLEVIDKKIFNLPVRGVRGNLMDVMEFFRFLKRVIHDFEKQ